MVLDGSARCHAGVGLVPRLRAWHRLCVVRSPLRAVGFLTTNSADAIEAIGRIGSVTVMVVSM